MQGLILEGLSSDPNQRLKLEALKERLIEILDSEDGGESCSLYGKEYGINASCVKCVIKSSSLMVYINGFNDWTLLIISTDKYSVQEGCRLKTKSYYIPPLTEIQLKSNSVFERVCYISLSQFYCVLSLSLTLHIHQQYF